MEKTCEIIWKGKTEEISMRTLTGADVDESMRKSVSGDKYDILLQKRWQQAMCITKAPTDFPRNNTFANFDYMEVVKPIEECFDELHSLKKKTMETSSDSSGAKKEKK